MVEVTIDPHSGFCFGVVYAIEVAERELAKDQRLFCLGDIVHNNMEVNRLKKLGLTVINSENLRSLRDCKVLIRAHGEPPETYKISLQNNIELIDASCPIVLYLQNMIHRGFIEMKNKNGQIVIYGKEGHAEVNGLVGQTNGTAIVIGEEQNFRKIDFSRPIRLYSQTTKSVEGFYKIVQLIRAKMNSQSADGKIDFEWTDSTCRQVSNRSSQLRDFASNFDVVIFVSGKKSSNGKILYHSCLDVNPHTYYVSSSSEIQDSWFTGINTVGICGATSTPMWLMEEIGRKIKKNCP
ncbi:MAG: 4-hydroxy-3-methylbut-2-enyl diphosphate reductase [Bacteroidales bacterium]|nr:4-hydroxy-3-methylbut-2-enyl diphosphate reductase [Bacteroidales bacterium]